MREPVRGDFKSDWNDAYFIVFFGFFYLIELVSCNGCLLASVYG